MVLPYFINIHWQIHRMYYFHTRHRCLHVLGFVGIWVSVYIGGFLVVYMVERCSKWVFSYTVGNVRRHLARL